MNSLAMLRWNHGGRNVSCATSQRGGKITKSMLPTPAVSLGALEASLRSAQARVEGSVQVAAIYSVGLGNMGQYVEEFVAQAPEAEVHIEYLHPDQVYERVLDGSVDLGLVSFPRKLAKLAVVPWRDEPMVLACPPRHPLASHAGVKVAQLADVKYVHFSKELGIRREIEYARTILREGTSADRQLAVFRRSGDLNAVVDHLIRETAQDA